MCCIANLILVPRKLHEKEGSHVSFQDQRPMGGSRGATSHLCLCLPCKPILSLSCLTWHQAHRAQFPAFRPGRNPKESPWRGPCILLDGPLWGRYSEEIATTCSSLVFSSHRNSYGFPSDNLWLRSEQACSLGLHWAICSSLLHTVSVLSGRRREAYVHPTEESWPPICTCYWQDGSRYDQVPLHLSQTQMSVWQPNKRGTGRQCPECFSLPQILLGGKKCFRVAKNGTKVMKEGPLSV